MNKIIVSIGDVHGCLEELDELLKIISFNPNQMRVVLLGDLMDRGPDPVGCIKRARELNLECVRGNHEDKHLRWHKHELTKLQTGKSNPMKQMSDVDIIANKSLSDDDLAWMGRLPYQLQLTQELFAVHAGVEPSVKWGHQNPAQLMRVRYVNENGKAIALNPDKSQPEHSQYWTEQYSGPYDIVYGHNVYDEVNFTRTKSGHLCVGVDTGCCFGNKLSALIVNTMEVVSVKAKQKYFTNDFE